MDLTRDVHPPAPAIIMPNLVPPVTTPAMAMAYKERIEAAVPESFKGSFTPLMTMYLTDNTTPGDVLEAKARGVVAFKMYPAGATTNSDSGVTDWKKCVQTLKAMEEVRYALDQGLACSRHVSSPPLLPLLPLLPFLPSCVGKNPSLFRNRATTHLHVVTFPFRGKSIP